MTETMKNGDEEPCSSDERKTQKNTSNDKVLRLRALGFCGADDSIDPNLLGLVCRSYPFVEFGVLFRPDKEGTPRYATADWVSRLGAVAARSGGRMRLAAHLCGSRVNEVLRGDDAFVSTLPALGFRRVQINATRVNGVNTSNLGEAVESFVALAERQRAAHGTEFILQKNEETRPLWEGVLAHFRKTSDGGGGRLPEHVTMLVDESKGTGVAAASWPAPPEDHEVGYAGGVGPDNVVDVLRDVAEAANGRPTWIDMESSLRTTMTTITDGNESRCDVFDLTKCYRCISAVCDDPRVVDARHPEFLVGGGDGAMVKKGDDDADAEPAEKKCRTSD